VTEPVPSTVTKSYPQRGPLQQFRFVESTAFVCFRCGAPKKSKLITVYNHDWSKKLCNGCYGRLLSLYEIKAGTATDDQRAEELASALVSAVALDDQRQAEQLFRTSEQRAEHLCAEGLRFVATAEHVAGQLAAAPQLEWSPAVIGLCKAVEAEIVGRIIRPLAAHTSRENLGDDKRDPDVGRMAVFCSEPSRKPPELGTFAHFLQTAINSQQRRQTSVLIRAFLHLAADWTGSQWLLDPNGFHPALTSLLTSFRNRAAHIDELGKEDYCACRDFVLGSRGLLWILVLSTTHHR
jgi:hypothetical protein